MRGVWQDLRYGMRLLRRSPAFTITAVLCLGIGIGGSTAIFSVVNAVLLRPLPYHDPDQLVIIRALHPEQEFYGDGASWPEFLDWKEQSRSFQSMAAFRWDFFELVKEQSFERLQGLQVTMEFFEVLQLKPAAGQFLSIDEIPDGDDHHLVLGQLM